MKNRRGFLLAEETLKIIIAVICIVFLVGFLVAIYMNNKTDKDMEMAKKYLEELVQKVNEDKKSVDIREPVGWRIIPWPRKLNTGEEIIPLSCSNVGWEHCTCVCKKKFYKVLIFDTSTFQGLADRCDDVGVCLTSKKQITLESNKFFIEITPSLKVEIESSGNYVVIK